MQWGDRVRDQSRRRVTVRLGVGLAGLVLAVAVAGSESTAAAAPVLVVGLAGRHNLYSLLGWIGGGAGVVGVAFWGLGKVVSLPLPPELLLGFGLAVGGGLGGVIRLLAVGEQRAETDETVTFERGGAEGGESSSEPRPADLFEESPDPILYFDDSGDGPVVRAVNPAFEETFGVTVTAVADAALADASMATDRVDDLVAAAAAGEPFRATVPCETADGSRPFRITTATRSDEAGTRGYLLYTPVEE